MRCKNCNVDLPEEYTHCPLCNEKSTPCESEIKGIRIAEYPKVETMPYKRNAFIKFIVFWVAIILISLVLYKTNVINSGIFAVVATLPACVWTLFVRPFKVKQLYKGNYIVMNFYSIALMFSLYSLASTGKIIEAVTIYLPLISIIIITALGICIFVSPKDNKRSAPYTIFMGVLSVIGIILTLAMQSEFSVYWFISLCVSAILLVYLLVSDGTATKEELKAKFSLQKRV
ncbi:MAG: hypothetical protein E7557_07385 [Ruminococcaceae bacterium]|nr:hypothetical protein [Oscillospiraceae bacterium]